MGRIALHAEGLGIAVAAAAAERTAAPLFRFDCILIQPAVAEVEAL